MTKRATYIIFTAVCALAAVCEASAQRYPERRVARGGDKLYNGGQFEAAETEYRRALEMQPSFPEATFNLANSLFRQEKGEEAARTYVVLAADSLLSPEIRSAASYNLGNVMLAGQKVDEAIESYKAALRLDPTDMDAKFNLAYAQRLKQQQEQQEQQQQDEQNQDQNKDQNSDGQQDKQEGEDNQDKQDGQDKQDKQPDGQDGDKQQPDKPDEQQGDKPQPSEPQDGSGEPKIDPSTAEQMLEAIQGEEDKTREKVNAKEIPSVGRSGKNW